MRFESGSRALALFLLDTTSLRQTTGCVSPDRLASRAEPSSLCSTKPDHFGRDEHTRRPRHPRISAWATGSYDSPQLKNRPPPLSPTWVLQVASLISEQLGRASFPIPSRFRGRERQRDESPKPKGQGNEPRREGQRTSDSWTLVTLHCRGSLTQRWPRRHLATFKNERITPSHVTSSARTARRAPAPRRQTGRCRR